MSEEEDQLSSLERVRKRLYDPRANATFAEPELAQRPVAKATGWKHLDTVRVEAEHMSGPARFFIVALVFFILTVGGAVVYLVWGGRAVSTNNVNITVVGPTTASSGDTVPLQITIENHNPVPLRSATLTVDFPSGTKSPTDPTQDLSLDTENLGDIPAGGTVERTVSASIFGSEQQAIGLPISVQYHTDQSNATFVKNDEYNFTITSSPITLTVNALSQVAAGQSVTLMVAVKSNATTPLDNVAVSATYPFGFAPSSATPPAVDPNNTLFVLGTLNPGDEKDISITGVLSGQQNDDRVFTFNAGTLTATDSPTLATTYTTKEADISLTNPFLATTLSVNQDTSDAPVVSAGQPVNVIVSWTNTLTTAITNAQIAVALTGGAFNPTSVESGNGFYQSSNSTVLFSPSTDAGLANLAPGDSGQGVFTFTTLSPAALASLSSPTVTMNVSITGNSVGQSNAPQAETATLTRIVKIGTNLSLASKLVHSIGPFANTGPWPPKPNSPTTYTVEYTLANSGNTVAGTQVTAALPPYVSFTGAATTGSGSITYDDTARTVTWTIGDVDSGASDTAAFQISFTPSTSQEGTSPVLLLPQQVTGTDRFTQRSISGSQPELNTQISADPAYTTADGSVQ